MEAMVKGFISAITADGKSACTVKSYRLDLEDFSEYIKENSLNVLEMHYSDFRVWMNSLEKRNLSAATRARKVSTIKSFFRYLSKMEIISQNPAENLEAPKLPKKQPKVISIYDAKALVSGIDYSSDEPKHMTCFRDYAIVATFLFTGVRREELVNVKLSDVHMDDGTILIHGKGNKERVVYINDSLHAILSEYIGYHRDVFKTAQSSEYLFPSIKAGKMNVATVNRVVNKAFEAAGIKEEGVSAHILRKRFATTVFTNTGDIATTSKMLGHSSPTVTMQYVRIDEDSMRNAANTVNF